MQSISIRAIRSNRRQKIVSDQWSNIVFGNKTRAWAFIDVKTCFWFFKWTKIACLCLFNRHQYGSLKWLRKCCNKLKNKFIGVFFRRNTLSCNSPEIWKSADCILTRQNQEFDDVIGFFHFRDSVASSLMCHVVNERFEGVVCWFWGFHEKDRNLHETTTK